MSYLSSYVFLRRRRGLTSRKLYVCLQTFLYVSCIYLVGLMSLNVYIGYKFLHFVRSRFKCSCFRATLLTVLRSVYPIGRISSGLSSGQTFEKVAGNSKILWTNFWHATVTVLLVGTIPARNTSILCIRNCLTDVASKRLTEWNKTKRNTILTNWCRNEFSTVLDFSFSFSSLCCPLI